MAQARRARVRWTIGHITLGYIYLRVYIYMARLFCTYVYFVWRLQPARHHGLN
jgi:hypothetical protein